MRLQRQKVSLCINEALPSGEGSQGSSPRSGAATGRGMPLTEVLCERAQLEKEYMTKWNPPKPQYRDQGSEAFLKRQYRFCSKGEIGYIQAKHIISALPEEGERPIKTRRKVSVDGWEKEEEEEERAAPTTRRQLERLRLVFRNTLLMCIAAFPQFPQFDLTKEDMDSFYDWFYGPAVAGRRPPPSDQTLLYAERNAWTKMHELMHSGLTLKQAMTKVKEDSLFWMREVYERVIHQHAKGKEKGPGKSKKGKFAKLTGRNPVERASPKTKERGREPSPNPLIGLLIGLSRIRKGCPSVVTTISRTNAKASVAGPTIAQW